MAREKEGQEFEEKVLYINRCAKVVKGGRKFSFSALILVGDENGKVGYGFAKANEVSDAIRKGSEAARKNIITFDMADGTLHIRILPGFAFIRHAYLCPQRQQCFAVFVGIILRALIRVMDLWFMSCCQCLCQSSLD